MTTLPIYENGVILNESNENETNGASITKSQTMIKTFGLKAQRIKKTNEQMKTQPDENKNNIIQKKYKKTIQK